MGTFTNRELNRSISYVEIRVTNSEFGGVLCTAVNLMEYVRKCRILL